MRFKGLCAAVALAVGLSGAAQAAPIIDTTPAFSGRVDRVQWGTDPISKARQKFTIDYDFTASDVTQIAYWGFDLWAWFVPEDELVYANYFEIDPARPETLKGRISNPFWNPPYENPHVNWKFWTDTPGTFRLSITSVGSVPEPSTWAIMILGLGAVGMAMRRRTRLQPQPS